MKVILMALLAFTRKLFQYMGYELKVKKIRRAVDSKDSDFLNLNIAAGAYVIPGFKSLDIYTPHYYKSKERFLSSRIEYDLRKDKLPFDDNAVDNIYISHAIEHVEDGAVKRFISESFRVLKKDGVLRIACPDALFLYKVSSFKNDYWEWRVSSLSGSDNYEANWGDCKQYDFLLRELSTPRMRFYKNRIPEKVISLAQIDNLSYKDLTDKLKAGLEFRPEYPGDHINNWDFARIKSLAEKAGFENIIESKCRGSVSKVMQGPDFDKTRPQMSLYVDLVK